MKLHLTQAEGRHLITGYGAGWVQVNETRYHSSLILTADQLLAEWPVPDMGRLTEELMRPLIELRPEVMLLGTGARQRFPTAGLLRVLAQSGVGYEIMDTAAACRTFNILMAEGRQVAAALIL